jgi:hypothetical protein
VVVSDHGQKVSINELAIHGDWLKSGNEGWVMFYNPNFDFTISSPSKPITLATGMSFVYFSSPPLLVMMCVDD